MRTIKAAGEHELDVRRSRFRCALAPVTSQDQARDFVQQRRRAHPDARHHCSAFVLGDDGEFQKSSDDGEPAGTAGTPMLEVLRHNEITNTVAVVTRYFGGVLLGAGGLVRAYGSAVSATLEQVGTVERRAMRMISTTVDYGVAGRLENELRAAGYRLADVDYRESVRLHILVPESGVPEFRTWIAETTGGAAEPELGELGYSEV
ncbi:YigZ family protein [Saccharopolyspora sp. HNM0983]|uniref:YigZ family protein n=1 Tax=Saccharopolyspora montiporae TaxID=2781240 RepID=A0A929BBX5_9PSEU|nr:YigZ family protein [Saccharopolyspora sp. HNM0983]MBE9374823.1 YigZ family protein [Saccharopolyspora sp. HNM0983]